LQKMIAMGNAGDDLFLYDGLFSLFGLFHLWIV
jgi:hypothetical protein